MRDPDITPRPIEPFGRKPIEIKGLPSWLPAAKPLDINVSIFDRAELFFHESFQYTKVTWWLLKIAVAIIKLIKAIDSHRPKESSL